MTLFLIVAGVAVLAVVLYHFWPGRVTAMVG